MFEWAIEKQKWGLVEFFASVGFDCETPFVIVSEVLARAALLLISRANCGTAERAQEADQHRQV